MIEVDGKAMVAEEASAKNPESVIGSVSSARYFKEDNAISAILYNNPSNRSNTQIPARPLHDNTSSRNVNNVMSVENGDKKNEPKTDHSREIVKKHPEKETVSIIKDEQKNFGIADALSQKESCHDYRQECQILMTAVNEPVLAPSVTRCKLYLKLLL